jgi:CRISPR-associated endonuclease/helicase Cas3
MTEIISHPGKPLIWHLREVADFCVKTIQSKKLSLSIDETILWKLGYIQGAIHDIGKATKNFQTYIRSKGEDVPQPKHHALISAYLAKLVAQDFLKRTNLNDFEQEILMYFIFTSVKRHHGNVLNFDDELETLEKKKEDVEILMQNFHEPEVGDILNELLAAIDLQYDWGSFKEEMKDLEEVFHEFGDFPTRNLRYELEELSTEKRAEYFYLHHLFFSTLLYSDKTDVKLGQDKLDRLERFNFDAIKEYRKEMEWDQPSDDPLNQLKNKAYSEGLENLDKVFKPDQHLYSITLPTGLGKTVTSLAIAMKMKQKLQHQNPRIVITIPFTSIIDQNYEVFNDIFQQPTSDNLLKHHHVAEPKYKSNGEDEVRSTEISQFLIETWQSEIVVTTFVQLLEGMLTNNKSKLLKLPNLMNSIIILDEIQQIHHERWELVRTAFRVLGRQYNCYFILMSATQPLIFTPQKEIVELIPDHKTYFKNDIFNRTRLINQSDDVISLADFTETVVSYHRSNSKKDILVILNTKDVTLDCFKQIRKHVEKKEANLYFLTTLITPYERKRIIDRIKKPKNALPNIIISTQLIEAGVDISVDTVFRVLAPLDAIIQAAGRANRYNEKETISEVYIYRIEELEKVTGFLYGKTLVNKTRNILKGKAQTDEKDYLALIEQYFKEVRIQSDYHDCEYLDHLVNLRFESLGKFQFIEDRKTESVFIQLNEEAQALWEAYEKIYEQEELPSFKKKEAFALIKSKFYDYVINVPIKRDQEAIVFDNEKEFHFYVSYLDSPSQCYHYNKEDFTENIGYVSSSLLAF